MVRRPQDVDRAIFVSGAVHVPDNGVALGVSHRDAGQGPLRRLVAFPNGERPAVGQVTPMAAVLAPLPVQLDCVATSRTRQEDFSCLLRRLTIK